MGDTIDHTARLPDELLLLVFSHLYALADHVACSSVCRRWRRVVRCGDFPAHLQVWPGSRPGTWQKKDYPATLPAPGTPAWDWLLRGAKAWQRCVTSVALNTTGLRAPEPNSRTEALLQLLAVLPWVRELQVEGGATLQTFLAAAPAGLTALRADLRSGLALSCLGRYPQLHTLTLRLATSNPDLIPLAACKALVRLTLHDLHLSPGAVAALAALTQLTALNVAAPIGVADLTALSQLGGLREVGLACVSMVDVGFLGACTGLTSVHVAGTSHVHGQQPLLGVDTLVASCPHVRVFHADVVALGPLTLALQRWRLCDLKVTPRGAGTLPAELFVGLHRLQVVVLTSDLAGLQFLSQADSMVELHVRGTATTLHHVHAPALTVLHLATLPLLADLDPLSSMPHLRHLDISACGRLASLEPVRACTSLTHFGLADCADLTDLGGLEGCMLLQELHVSKVAVAGFGFLAALTGLITLCLDTPTDPGTQLACLATCTRLARLALPPNWALPDLHFLSALPRLHALALPNRCPDTPALVHLTHLRWLDARGARLPNLDVLCGLTRLVGLDLGGATVGDLSPLGRLPLLACLDLRSVARVEDFAGLSACRSLVCVRLSFYAAGINGLREAGIRVDI